MTPRQFHELVMRFPHTELSTAYGQPAYKAFGKFLTRLRQEDASVVLCQISFDQREMLCAADPATFHFTDHYRNYPIVLARLKRIDAKTLRGYLMKQWRHAAPKTWLKAWDAGAELPALSVKTGSGRRKTMR